MFPVHRVSAKEFAYERDGNNGFQRVFIASNKQSVFRNFLIARGWFARLFSVLSGNETAGSIMFLEHTVFHSKFRVPIFILILELSDQRTSNRIIYETRHTLQHYYHFFIINHQQHQTSYNTIHLRKDMHRYPKSSVSRDRKQSIKRTIDTYFLISLNDIRIVLTD